MSPWLIDGSRWLTSVKISRSELSRLKTGSLWRCRVRHIVSRVTLPVSYCEWAQDRDLSPREKLRFTGRAHDEFGVGEDLEGAVALERIEGEVQRERIRKSPKS